MAEYLVRKIEVCPVCGGDGSYPNPDWQEINEANNGWMEARGIKTFTDEAAADWNRRIKERWPYSKPPSEEEFCGECEGRGKIESLVPLADALRDLGVMTGLAAAEMAPGEC